MPSFLVCSTREAAAAFAAEQPASGMTCAKVAVLTKEELRDVFFYKCKAFTAAILLASAFGAGGLQVVQEALPQVPGQTVSPRVVAGQQAQLHPEAGAKKGPQGPSEQLLAIKREYEKVYKDYLQATKAGRGIGIADWTRRTKTQPLLRRALVLARENPAVPVAYDAPEWVVNSGLVDFPEVIEALDLLLKDHTANKNLSVVCRRAMVYRYLYGRTEEFLRAVLDKNPDRQVRGIACVTLARVLHDYARFARRMKDPANKGRFNFPSPLAERLGASDPQQLTNEAARFYRTAIEKYADVRLPPTSVRLPPSPKDATVKQEAEAALFEMQFLQVSQVAPKINGEDVDGKPLRLSDHRGKVVVLVFWATWCAPCMAMVPHERELTKRLEGKRFVLLGVNGDEDRAKARRAMREKQMTWPSWWAEGPEGALALKWNVQGWPTVYVLDAKGVIRYKDVQGKELDAAVDTLLQEMDSRGTPLPAR